MIEFRASSILAAAAALMLVPLSNAAAQRQPASPEQRIERLERQIDQLQRQVFPRGRPADTAGYSTEPAATQSSVLSLDQRLDAIERQMAEMLRQSEENGHLAQTVQSELTKIRAESDARLTVIEQKLAAGVAAAPVTTESSEPAAAATTTPPKPKPKPKPKEPEAASNEGTGGPAMPEADPAEAAYTEGFKLWEAGNYDEAISSLRAFTSAYPKHRRVSFANNLVGRSLLDKGEARAAAQALLANYRGNPAGERAPDSLYYLGRALMKLGQPKQACNAFSELDAVYGSKIRAELKKLEDEAKTEAKCG